MTVPKPVVAVAHEIAAGDVANPCAAVAVAEEVVAVAVAADQEDDKFFIRKKFWLKICKFFCLRIFSR